MSKGHIYKSSTSSIQNAVILLLFVIGMFVMYRYVKTIETETKLVQNHIIELTQKVQAVVANQEDCRSLIATLGEGGGMTGGVCPMPSSNGRRLNDANIFNDKEFYDGGEYEDDREGGEEENDEEQSVKSGDITNILRKVIGDATDMMNQFPEFEQELPPRCSLEEVDDDDEDENDGDEEAEDEQEEQDEHNEGEEDGSPPKDTRSEATSAITDRGESARVVMNIDEDDNTLNLTEDQLCRKTNDDLKGLLRGMGLSIKGTKAELVARILSG